MTDVLNRLVNPVTVVVLAVVTVWSVASGVGVLVTVLLPAPMPASGSRPAAAGLPGIISR